MTTYREAGVNIDEGDRLVELIKPHAKSTARPELLGGIGGFGGLFALAKGKYEEPVLVSGTDGVGTKLKLAFDAKRHDTVGIDLVAMSVNDIAICGAEPLFFLDYYATSKLRADNAAVVIKGIADGCRQAGCALIGGETAEMPGFYGEGEYDLAGFAVGIVERSKIIDGSKVRPGDAIVGVASSGLHSNGFSLVRRILQKRGLLLWDVPRGFERPLGDTLLAPTRIYVKEILALIEQFEIRSMAHITGGGLPGNVPRNLPENMKAVIFCDSWRRPFIFDFLASQGEVPQDDLYATFNMGIGLTLVMPPEQADAVIALLADRSIDAWKIGAIEEGAGEATVELR